MASPFSDDNSLIQHPKPLNPPTLNPHSDCLGEYSRVGLGYSISWISSGHNMDMVQNTIVSSLLATEYFMFIAWVFMPSQKARSFQA